MLVWLLAFFILFVKLLICPACTSQVNEADSFVAVSRIISEPPAWRSCDRRSEFGLRNCKLVQFRAYVYAYRNTFADCVPGSCIGVLQRRDHKTNFFEQYFMSDGLCQRKASNEAIDGY